MIAPSRGIRENDEAEQNRTTRLLPESTEAYGGRGVLAQVENRGYAPRNAQEPQDMLHGSRLGGLIFMMKGRHGVCLP
jgi:hypothetical protein